MLKVKKYKSMNITEENKKGRQPQPAKIVKQNFDQQNFGPNFEPKHKKSKYDSLYKIYEFKKKIC